MLRVLRNLFSRFKNIYDNEIWNYFFLFSSPFFFLFICTFVVIKITFELFIHLFTKNRKPGSYSNQEHCRYGKSFVPKLFIQEKKIWRNKRTNYISSGESP